MIGIIIALCAVAFVLLCIYVRKKQHFWQDKGVAVPPYLPFIGHLYELLASTHRWKATDKLYNQFKEQKIWGMYEMWRPTLWVADREIAKAMLVKDADHFIDRRDMNIGKSELLGDKLSGEMLLNMKGEQWKNLRSIMSPVFTSSKMKAMFTPMREQADKLVAFAQQQNATHGHVVMDQAIGRYMLAVISSCAFGLTIPITDEPSVFELKAQSMLAMDKWVVVRALVHTFLPGRVLNWLGMELTHPNIYFFNDLIKQTMSERKKKGIRRHDFLDLMQDALKECQQSDNPKYAMSENTVIAQAVLFLFAGYDTSSTAVSFTTFLLASNQHVQDTLRQELTHIVHESGQITYEGIADAHYLDACFNESLRLYGPGFVLERKCTRPYRVPGTDITLDKGSLVNFPNWSYARDSDAWEEPEDFKPERFMPENKDRMIPYSHMPFGAGPRNCIAMRFAQMEAKIAIATLVLNHRLTLPVGREKLVLNESALVMKATDHGIHIKLEPI